MQKMYPADNVGKDGKVYPTVGEHIRNSGEKNVTAETISDAIHDNTDRAKVSMKLDVTADDLKTALIALLTGNTAYFGGLDTDELTSSQLSDIKVYLGIG
jgi:hypothetical protein|nr:MAG TPA: hypothetical protein [Caudoviricetes sp.]